MDDIDFEDSVFDEDDQGLTMSSSSSGNTVGVREPNLPKGIGVVFISSYWPQ